MKEEITNIIDVIAVNWVLSFPVLIAIFFVTMYLIDVLSRENQRILIVRSSKTLFLLKRCHHYVQEMTGWSVEEDDLHAWNTRLNSAMTSINSSMRAGLIIGSDGCSVSIYPFLRDEINNQDSCANLVSKRVIKQAGLAGLKNTEVLAWMLSVVHTFVLIKLEDLSNYPSVDEKKCKALLERYTSRLAGLITSCPLRIRGFDGCDLKSVQKQLA
jgi:hypothetical protein